MRTCLLSLAVAEELGLDAAERSCVYYVALFRFIGDEVPLAARVVAVARDAEPVDAPGRLARRSGGARPPERSRLRPLRGGP